MKCVNCSKKAFISLAYGPHKFCQKHFLAFFEKRFRKNLRLNKMVGKNEKVLIALSGGLNSVLMLHLLKETLPQKRKPLEAVYVHEKLGQYSEKNLQQAAKHCRKLKIKLKEVKLKKKAKNYSELVKERNKALSDYAKKCGTQKIASGKNLDFLALQALKKLFEGKILQKKRKLKNEINPLSTSPGEEAKLYCQLKKISFSREKNPLAEKNVFYQQALKDLEKKSPGIRFSILKSLKEIAEFKTR